MVKRDLSWRQHDVQCIGDIKTINGLAPSENVVFSERVTVGVNTFKMRPGKNLLMLLPQELNVFGRRVNLANLMLLFCLVVVSQVLWNPGKSVLRTV